ncbi:TRAP transporter large permease subunit [Clostridium sp. AM58-1XD]|uniref:TRAP transporter large permease n=1 Tax=Clostridium sp. AM58-1XD TaxID=2292307 RepID=UPI000E46BACD|nr:TRAP transporter large permease subunit [Clostridium sp. AM58-1XD]RGY97144.1 C4-dicarboxylate ABC transporter permease [Clostridium sp. AM58-1XD]
MVPILLIGLIVLFISSTPIMVALGLSGFLSLIFGSDVDAMVIIQRLVGGIDSFALMALPFFIFAANLMDSGGLSKRLLDWARALIGHVCGGIAASTQLASMFFGALSGSSPATIIAIGKLMYPELKERKYPNRFIAGLLASSGSVALVIPPSVTIIVFCVTTGVSVGKCFMAGITAGIILGLSSLIYIYFFAKKHNLPRDKKATKKELLVATKRAGAALMVPVIILGGIYSGICTPTESAAISAVYALFVGMFVYKELTLDRLWKVAIESAIGCAQVLVLISAATVLAWILTVSQISTVITTVLLSKVTSKIVFLLILNLILLVMGMFMDGSAAILIIAPLVFNMGINLGVDGVHMCIIMISNLALGMYTPPFGMNLFVTNSITKMDMLDMLPGVWPFLGVNLASLLIITYCPALIMALPNLVG